MMFTLVTPPASEPIPLSDLKAALRVDHDADDAVISQMAMTARTFIERRLDHAFLAQTWTLTLDAVPCGPVSLRPGRVSAVTSVTATYGEGSPTELDTDQWCLVHREPATLTIDVPSSSGSDELSALTITFTAGHSDAGDIPADLLRAIYLLTAHYYEERELFRRDRYVPVPLSVEALLEAYREVRL